MDDKLIRDHSRSSLYKLLCYPFMNTVAWMGPTYYDAAITTDNVVYNDASGGQGINFFNFGFPFLMGTATSIAFILTNRRLVAKYLFAILIYVGIFSEESKFSDVARSEFDHTAVPTPASSFTSSDFHSDRETPSSASGERVE